MVDIQSKEVIDKISDDLKVQPSLQIPRELAKQIQLVYNVNPEREIKIASVTASDSTAVAIMTTSATKNTFLIGASLSTAKDVVSTSLFSAIRGHVFGQAATAILFAQRYEPVTAGAHSLTINFSKPIKLERASVVSVSNSTNVASIDTTGIVYFFETDPQ